MSSVKIDLVEMRKLSGLGPQYPEWQHEKPAAAPVVTTEARRGAPESKPEYDSPWDRDVAQVKKFLQATDKKALAKALLEVTKKAREFRAAVKALLTLTRAVPVEAFDTLRRPGSDWSGLLPAIEFFAGAITYLDTSADQAEGAWDKLLRYDRD